MNKKRKLYDAFVKLTLDGSLPLDEANPFVNNIYYLQMVMEEYEKDEQYEICKLLKERIEILKESNYDKDK